MYDLSNNFTHKQALPNETLWMNISSLFKQASWDAASQLATHSFSRGLSNTLNLGKRGDIVALHKTRQDTDNPNTHIPRLFDGVGSGVERFLEGPQV